jgi:rifampicin phosphotransferase
MDALITAWDQPDFSSQPVGGKARALAHAAGARFNIPAWVVVLPSATERLLAPGTIDLLTRGDKGESPKEALRQSLSADAVAELLGILRQKLPGVTHFAVRSSAVDEDSRMHSFAGQLDSFLNVPLAEVAERIVDVWCSGFSERVYLYREQNRLTLPPPVPAVIVQAMVRAETAGVAFSMDPVSGRSGTALVAAVRGLGDKLVSGESNSDNFEIDRAQEITKRSHSEPAAISDEQAIRIADLARQAAHQFGVPQDIEWAIADDALYLLQSRPITSLTGKADLDGRYQLWDNSNIAESYAGVTTPLTFSFARHVYEEVYRQFVKILQVPTARIERERDTFGRMLGLIQGRVYYNLLSWYRILGMLPGFSINRRFMEQMMGVSKSLPDDLVEEIARANRTSKWRDCLDLARTLLGLAGNHFWLNRKMRAFYRRLQLALQLPATPLQEQRADELAAYFRQLQRELLVHWDAPLINDFFAMIYYGLLRTLVKKWCDDQAGSLQNNLLAGQGAIISEEPARRLVKMAELARGDFVLIATLETGPWSQIQTKLAGHPELDQALRSYLDQFGDRCLEELKLETITLGDDPVTLARSIGRLARQERGQITRPVSASDLRNAAEKQALSALGPVRRLVFKKILAVTRARVRDRENLRFERTRVFGRVRRIFVEVGRRLQASGQLVQDRDIFYLTYEEALAFVEGTAVTTSLAELVNLRKKEFETYHRSSPADRFETRGMVYVGNSFQAPAEAAPQGNDLRGIGCCPGVVRGRIRVILDPQSATPEPGEILVARRTDPGWITLLPAAAGLLVEFGSLLSHSAIVTREMGIPSIVAIPNLTKQVKTGDLVEMDGSRGTVNIISHAETNAGNAVNARER